MPKVCFTVAPELGAPPQIHQFWPSSAHKRTAQQTHLGCAGRREVLPYNQSEDDYTHVVVYTMSSLTEQTTPTFLAISDTGSYVSGMSLLDRRAPPQGVPLGCNGVPRPPETDDGR